MRKIYILLAALFVFTLGYSADFTDVKIYLNPGHGGYDPNDRNVLTIPFEMGDTLGYYESKSNLIKGLELRNMLQANGATVYMSRTQNRSEDDRVLSQVAEEANANGVDAFLSIHSNAFNASSNYLLLIFHGRDNSPKIPESLPQAKAAWPRLANNPLTTWTAYTTSTNIRGDSTFYGTYGLGVLTPLTVPGFLSEGSFHDYKPETHRLLNPDYCKLEAERFYKYYCDYFQADLPATGTISGWVKGKDQRITHPLFAYNAGTTDQWLPLNGAQVKLMNEAGDSIDNYSVDSLYNGVYTFRDIAPGNYKLRFTADDHNPMDTMVTVTAANETAMKVLLFNPDNPLYKEIKPDYPEPVQEAGVIPLNHYNFQRVTEANPDWLNGAGIRKVTYGSEKLYILTEEPKIHVVNATTFEHIKELNLTGIAGGTLILSDINIASDGKLLACNKETVPFNHATIRFKMYMWDNDDAAPQLLYQTNVNGLWNNGVMGESFAVSGSSQRHFVYVPSVTTGTSKAIRMVGIEFDVDVPNLGTKVLNDNVSPAPVKFSEGLWGEKFKLVISPNGKNQFIVDGEKIVPTEYKFNWEAADKADIELISTFNEQSGYQLQNKASGVSFFRNAGRNYMVSPNSNADGSNVGIVLFDVGNGLNNAKKVSDFLPEGGLGTTPAPYMWAKGFASGYDLTLIGLAEKQGVKRFSTIPGTGTANVYASELKAEETSGGYKLHFTLNDNIESGQINILEGENIVHSIALGALSKGLNSVDLTTTTLPGGTFNWSVIVNSTTVDRPYKFTDNAQTQLQFYSPRGVAVDNSFESPYFGRVYASETAGGTVTNRTTNDGIYILNSALEDITGQNATAYAGGVTWGGGSSPMRLAVAPDGKVFLTDWTDSNSGIWVMDAGNPSAPFTKVFEGTRAPSGLVSNGGVNIHGSISHAWVTGIGDDMKLFTFDEDYVDAAATSPGNLLRYDIGNITAPWKTAPSAVVYNDALNGNLQQNMNSCIAPDARGGWWISQYRASDSKQIPSLIHVNTAGMADFNSGETPELIVSSYTGGMAVTEDGNRVAIGGPQDEVRVFDVTYSESGIPGLKLAYTIKPAMGSNTVGISFDKAGNLYIISNSSERLGVWALPKAENTFTTPAPSVQTIAVEGTGLKDVKGKPVISVYPNPVKDFVTIKSEQSSLESIEIFDINGKMVKQENVIGQEKEMNISELTSGAYIIRIKTEKGIESVRILKK